MLRIALLGLSHEANTFSSHPVDTAATEAATLRGEEILERHAGGTSTMAGYLTACEAHGVEAVPLVLTNLVPAGPITADALAVRTEELLTALRRSGPFDGVLVDLHGAAVGEDIDDVDGHLLRAIRETVGPDVLVGTSLDLHANVSTAMCEHADVLNTYRTNPHVDAREVAEEVGDLIIRAVRGEIRPTVAHVALPAAVNILCQNTDEPPMRDLIDRARSLMDEPGVLSASVAEGYPYADVPEMGMSVVVITDADGGAAASHARKLADEVWSRRARFDVPGVSAAAAVAAAQRAARTPVLLLDVGDNIGAGSPGDSVVLLNAAREAGFESLLTIVADPASAAACTSAGVGAQVDLILGARTDPATGPPVRATATVLALHDGTFEATGPVHAGWSHFEAGPSAAVRLDTGQTVIVTTEVVLPFSVVQLTTLGLAPADFAAIVAKGVHSPLAGYGPHVAEIVRVDTPGVTAANLHRFTYVNRRRPMYPYEIHTTFDGGAA
ncbi:M81 family metallopeptidase [Jiangella asiatica]|uniref:M81 family peptidase n=1 Tax=Jiangella asiatica TaxID=2530372 RepID=A0A4R5DNG1_9ACTN|nr:M81 family metallopeptidase [Jiangella asiatica]TDE13521.1 M81 family peptidase [Jiangella asiatica]